MMRHELGVREIVDLGDNDPLVVDDNGDVMPYDDFGLRTDDAGNDDKAVWDAYADEESAEVEQIGSNAESASVAAAGVARVHRKRNRKNSKKSGQNELATRSGRRRTNQAKANQDVDQSNMPLMHLREDPYGLPENVPRMDLDAYFGHKSIASGWTPDGGYYETSKMLPPMKSLDLENRFDFITYRGILSGELRRRQKELQELENSDAYKAQRAQYDLDESRHNDNSPIPVDTQPLVEKYNRLLCVIRQVQLELRRIEEFNENNTK